MTPSPKDIEDAEVSGFQIQVSPKMRKLHPQPWSTNVEHTGTELMMPDEFMTHAMGFQKHHWFGWLPLDSFKSDDEWLLAYGEGQIYENNKRILALYRSNQMPPAIIIDGFVGDGLHRYSFYQAIGEKMPVAQFRTKGKVASLKRRADAVLKKTEFQGVPIHLDRPEGFVQKLDTPEGPKERLYTCDYGFVPGTEDHDGEELDVFIGPNPEAETVYVIKQNKHDGTFDEHKCMLGFDNKEDAIEVYGDHIPRKLIRSVEPMSFDDWQNDFVTEAMDRAAALHVASRVTEQAERVAARFEAVRRVADRFLLAFFRPETVRKDPYMLLGLPPNFDSSMLKSKYREMALKSHPDRGGSTELMQDVNEAYDVLSDPTKRQKYDQWKAYVAPASKTRPSPRPQPPAEPPPAWAYRDFIGDVITVVVMIRNELKDRTAVGLVNEVNNPKRLNRPWAATIQLSKGLPKPLNMEIEGTPWQKNELFFNAWKLSRERIVEEFIKRLPPNWEGLRGSPQPTPPQPAPSPRKAPKAPSAPPVAGPPSSGADLHSVSQRLDHKGTDQKDKDRVRDIIKKSNGDPDKALALARQMAKSITGYEKAYRRYLAAESDNYHDLAEIFFNRFTELFKTGKAASLDECPF